MAGRLTHSRHTRRVELGHDRTLPADRPHSPADHAPLAVLRRGRRGRGGGHRGRGDHGRAASRCPVAGGIDRHAGDRPATGRGQGSRRVAVRDQRQAGPERAHPGRGRGRGRASGPGGPNPVRDGRRSVHCLRGRGPVRLAPAGHRFASALPGHRRAGRCSRPGQPSPPGRHRAWAVDRRRFRLSGRGRSTVRTGGPSPRPHAGLGPPPLPDPVGIPGHRLDRRRLARTDAAPGHAFPGAARGGAARLVAVAGTAQPGRLAGRRWDHADRGAQR